MQSISTAYCCLLVFLFVFLFLFCCLLFFVVFLFFVFVCFLFVVFCLFVVVAVSFVAEPSIGFV